MLKRARLRLDKAPNSKELPLFEASHERFTAQFLAGAARPAASSADVLYKKGGQNAQSARPRQRSPHRKRTARLNAHLAPAIRPSPPPTPRLIRLPSRFRPNDKTTRRMLIAYSVRLGVGSSGSSLDAPMAAERSWANRLQVCAMARIASRSD